MPTSTSPGWRTTEFWTSLGLGGSAAGVGLEDPDPRVRMVALGAAAFVAVGYTIVRWKTKEDAK